jgi:thiol-disulfide isomerase/thioredoxin
MDPVPGADDVPPGTPGPLADPPVEPGSLGPHPERHPDDLPPERLGRPAIPAGVLWALALAVVVLAIASWVAFSNESSTPAPPDARLTDPGATAPVPGLSSPDVVGQQISSASYPTFDGDTTSLAAYNGTPMVVNFWASSCPPCIVEMPALERVHQDLGADVAFVGLAVTDPEDAARELASETGVSFDLGFDRDGSIIRSSGGVVLPTTVFVGADGAIVEVHSKELDETELREKIQAHFGVTAPATP